MKKYEEERKKEEEEKGWPLWVKEDREQRRDAKANKKMEQDQNQEQARGSRTSGRFLHA